MIQWVWEAARRCRMVERVVIATDDARVCECAHGFGAECLMTGECASGTDRVAQVAGACEYSVILNIQGDEPLLDPAWVEALVAPFERDPAVEMTTLRTLIRDSSEADDPNVVKVVVRQDESALYFSRSCIPHPRQAGGLVFKHVGLYGYRREFLLRFASMPPSPLEVAESLEQLRALEAGARIAVPALEILSVAVDRPEDIGRVESFLKLAEREPPPAAAVSQGDSSW